MLNIDILILICYNNHNNNVVDNLDILTEMKENKLKNLLIELGLNENEAVIYLVSLSLGHSTILKISQAAEIKRTTVYSIVDSLKQKGLMNIELKGWKKLYVAQNPEKLYSTLEAKRELLKDSLPEFSALYNLKGGENFIKYYEGLESVKSVYESMIRDIKPRENYMVVTDQERWFNLDREYFSDFMQRRAKLNTNIRLLFQNSEVAREFKKKEQIYNEKIKILPQETELTTNLVIIPRRVLIHQLTHPIIGIVIENRSVIQMHKEMFEIIWNSIKENDISDL